jgi:hypothetical protein
LTSHWRKFRRRILTPDVSETQLDVRGFHKKDAESQELLETVGKSFLTGYGHAAEARTPAEAAEHLEKLPERFRGFAYEGAAMGFAVRDGLPLGRSRNVAEFLAGPGRHQVYISYCGIGWAMARLPKFRWPDSGQLDPLLRWLVLDGYGFHQAYFHTERYVHQHFQDPRFPWPAEGPAAYAGCAIDQGIGRALWFVGCTDVGQVTTMIGKFPESRHADLYAGVGLAATYAGGAGEDELNELRERAGTHRPQLAQGSAFAAEARISAGLLVPHTEAATQTLCGTTAEKAARITQDVRDDAPDDGPVPAYEAWRQRVADELVSIGRD